jgi:hypothetical protein
MPVEVMFVAIAGIIATFFLIRAGMRHEERKLELTNREGGDGRIEAILAATQQEVTKLRERVQVLEKLVTDDDRKLASDIERLRRSGDDVRR